MLLLDAGNSYCKWVRVINGEWIKQGLIANVDFDWKTFKESLSLLGSPNKILVSNVAGSAMEQRLHELSEIWSCPVEFIAAKAAQCGVSNNYDQAAQLGSDRWAALIAAWNKYQQASLVVNCGTATTVDALSETGEFLGGLILPGINLMESSLLDKTAQLEGENSRTPGEVHNFPRNTGNAIKSGVIFATAGAIQHQYALLAEKYPVHCILSGGAASKLLPHLGFKAEQVDNIVLHGLQIIGQNCSVNNINETVSR